MKKSTMNRESITKWPTLSSSIKTINKAWWSLIYRQRKTSSFPIPSHLPTRIIITILHRTVNIIYIEVTSWALNTTTLFTRRKKIPLNCNLSVILEDSTRYNANTNEHRWKKPSVKFNLIFAVDVFEWLKIHFQKIIYMKVIYINAASSLRRNSEKKNYSITTKLFIFNDSTWTVSIRDNRFNRWRIEFTIPTVAFNRPDDFII